VLILHSEEPTFNCLNETKRDCIVTSAQLLFRGAPHATTVFRQNQLASIEDQSDHVSLEKHPCKSTNEA
jgi:hypothetical protein